MRDGRAWTARDLREPTGRVDGMTSELRKLQQLGLIRHIGRSDSNDPSHLGPRANLYKIIPLHEIEQTARTLDPATGATGAGGAHA